MGWRSPSLVKDARWALFSLLTLAVLLKVMLLAQRPILARDGIHYIHFAQDLGQKPWVQVLREQPYHPGYPLTIGATAWVGHLFFPGEQSPEFWQWCAHLSASLAGVLLVVPLWGIARRWLPAGVAWLGVAFFLILPATVQITSDTLAESWLLVILLTALWCLLVAVEREKMRWWMVAGTFAGVGYWFRLEALVIPLAAGLFLLTRRWWMLNPWEWRQASRAALSMGSVFALIIFPYVLVLGKFSARPSAGQILHAQFGQSGDSVVLSGGHALLASRMQPGVNGLQLDAVHLWDAIKLVVTSHGKAGNYFIWPLAAVGLGMWLRRRRLAGIHGIMICFAAVYLAMLVRVAYAAGYTSERHTLPVVAIACCWAGIGLFALVRWITRRVHGELPQPAWLMPLMVVGIAGLCLPRSLHPLHAGQEGHRQAGVWLARHLQAGDRLIDPYQWATYYAGIRLDAPNGSGTVLAVVDPSDLDLNRQRAWRDAGVMATSAETLMAWPTATHPRLLVKRARLPQERQGVASRH